MITSRYRAAAAVSALFVLCLSVQAGEANRPFLIGGMTVRPGTTEAGYLDVPAGEDGATSIPITVVNGSLPGRTLALIAGVHGYEYPPILALYRLKEMIDPLKLSGTLIMVHIANLPAFQRRIIYYNPLDWQNLNRVFPGDPQGTVSQRIADVLRREVIDRCDALIDMHCGDGNESLIPYCYWMVSGRDDLDRVSKDMVLAFGIRHIIIDETRSRDLSDSKYLGNTAVLLSKPAITTESGFLGRSDEEDIIRNIEGIQGVMRYFKMIEGRPSFVIDPVWIDRFEVVYSDADGLFHPLTYRGYFVREGELVGFITDFLGRPVREFRSPFTGMVLYIIATPPISRGEPVFEVGRIREE